VAWPDDHLEEVEARADGTLVWPPRGTGRASAMTDVHAGGFDRTFGEMTGIEKHGRRRSVWPVAPRRAFVKLAELCLDQR